MANVAVSAAASVGIGMVSRVLNPAQSTVNRVKNEAQRIEDLGAPDSSFGYGLAEFMGIYRVNGCSLIWALDLIEQIVTNTETATVRQGKGAGGGRQMTITETDTATYYMTAAFLIGGEVADLNKVWANGVLIYDREGSNEIIDAFNTYTTFYPGRSDQSVDPTIAATEGEVSAMRGWSYIVFDRYPIELYRGSGFPKIDVEVKGLFTQTPQRVRLDDAIHHVCSKAGIPEEKVVFLGGAGLGTFWTYGLTFENNGQSPADFIEELAQIHFLDYYEEGGVLYIYQKAVPSAITYIPAADLGARSIGQGLETKYKKTKVDPESLPATVRVEFLSVGKNYESNNVFFTDPSAANYKSDRVSTTMVASETDMASAASRFVYQAKAEAHKLDDLYLPPSYAGLGVGDHIALLGSEVSRVYVITEKTIAADYRVVIKAIGTPYSVVNAVESYATVSDYNPISLSNSNLTSVAVLFSGVTLTEGVDYTVDLVTGTVTIIEGGAVGIGDDITIVEGLPEGAEITQEPTPIAPDVVTDYPPQGMSEVGTATLNPLDIPLVRDSDPDGTLYVAVDGDTNWIGGGIYLSRDSGASYAQVASISQSSITGTVVIATPSVAGLDEVTVIRVSGVTGLLSSVTQAKFDLGEGLICLVGSEIIMARDADLVSPGVYDLSYLQRGYRGTEWATGGHGINEDFVLLSGPLARVTLTTDDIGRTLRLKAVGLYGSEPTVTTYASITYTGASFPLKITGFSPTQGDIGDAITIHGSRFTGATTASIDGVPLVSFSVISDGIITGNIDTGTTTGKVSITTPTGTAESLTDFVIFTPSVDFADIGGLARDNADLADELDAKLGKDYESIKFFEVYF